MKQVSGRRLGSEGHGIRTGQAMQSSVQEEGNVRNSPGTEPKSLQLNRESNN